MIKLNFYFKDMPVFHTKTIESILEPVSKQVGQLVILHEEGQDGNALPPLDKPVSVVQQAVANLYKVGTETVEEFSDLLLKRDMPPVLEMVQAASDSLGQAAQFIAADPYRKDFQPRFDTIRRSARHLKMEKLKIVNSGCEN